MCEATISLHTEFGEQVVRCELPGHDLTPVHTAGLTNEQGPLGRIWWDPSFVEPDDVWMLTWVNGTEAYEKRSQAQARERQLNQHTGTRFVCDIRSVPRSIMRERGFDI